MRTRFLMALVGVAALATSAAAQPPAHGDERDAGTLCLDTLGINHPPTCKTMSATRLESKPDICLCLGNWVTVKVPWCAKGQHPPAESADYERARYAYASKNHLSLFGFAYKDQPACINTTKNGQ
jgi:hypothetical protein